MKQAKVERLRAKLEAAWQRTDALFDIVPESELFTAPIVWRHPFIFYIGHLPAFSWNQICGAILRWRSFNPHFDELFCRGIDPDVDTGECHWHPEVPDKWPGLDEVLQYRDSVRGAVLDSLEAVGCLKTENAMVHGGRVFQMVLEHEYMHQETLLYMMQQLPPDKKRRPKNCPPSLFHGARTSEMISVPAGKARLGAQFQEIHFGWDNEFGETFVEVPQFKIDSLPVTNQQYFEFVNSAGYEDPRYWRRQDWAWKQLEKKRHPTQWVRSNGLWFYRSMFDIIPLSQAASWPVYVSLAEARAYARWRGKRLPMEAEFHRAAYSGPDDRESVYPWGDEEPERLRGNFNFISWSPMPVGCRPAGSSRWGVHELVGNGWEWTDTPFAPFPGFVPYISSYPDYSQDFFDGKHFVLKGASWATVADLLRPSFRNWYQAHYPYVFAKFRCVTD
ncbi:MAG TPA: SUMF1/EgtB/PvdO family nonheme iron enzyme [Candidatus Binatia bacterium]|nr:SUMF1/EgtB/PvdO family nonheme iron enzyme [Candidatus Binatia bacterium]